MMIKSGLFVIMCALCGVVLVLFAQEQTTECTDKQNTSTAWWMPKFVEVNPPNQVFEYYIWMPRRCYLLGEPIPLYIEKVAKKRIGISVPNPILTATWSVKLLILKDKETYLFLDSEEFPYGCYVSGTFEFKGDYIPPIDEIPVWRLHGNLVMPYKVLGDVWVVDLEPGDCYVMKINDITELWYMHLMDPEFDPRGYYQVQFECSNIIEFEIR